MESYVETNYNHHNEGNEEEKNSGLLRYRSAPSSLFFGYTQNLNGSDGFSETYERKPQKLSSCSQIGYSGSGSGSSQLPPQYPKQSVAMEKTVEIGHGGFNLNRQISSPAGFFSQLHAKNGNTIMRGLGSFRVANGTNGESGPRSGSLGLNHLPRIPEIQNESVKETSADEVKFRNHEDNPGFDNSTGYLFASLNSSGSEASHLLENGGLLNRPTMLSHHVSLPKTSSEMAVIEKLLHFQDTVSCKVSAKRGFATHPRSIAERERRNRISERMRKLQDLVPNMDKQTNTADMLDLAVDYIKNLQDEYKVLTEDRAKCRCVHLQ